MKGFIKTFEAIVASIIILASLTYFFTLPPRLSGWSDALLQTEVEDSLITLYKSGDLSYFIDNNDGGGLNTRLKEMFPTVIDFSPEISGIPNPDIFISVIGDATDRNNLKSILGDTIVYKNRMINIYVKEASWDDIDPETNVVFLFGYQDLSSYVNKIETLLRNHTTIFIFGDLTQNQVNDGILNETFDLSWSDIGVPSSVGKFHDYENPNITSFRVSNYIFDSFNQSRDADFDGFNTNSRIAINDKSIVESSDARSSFSSINEHISGDSGRTVWLAGYDFLSAGEDIDRLKNLTRAIIMWASGERYKMDYPYEKTVPDIYSTASHIMPGEDSYEVKIIFWRILY